MANPDHVDVVRAGDEAIRKFLDRNSGVQFDLSGAELAGADLHGANLSAAFLDMADLHGADLHGANLQMAELLGAELQMTNLEGADLHGAGLQRVDLTNAKLSGASLHRANLTGADLTGADLDWANLYGAALAVADLTGVTLRRASLHGADLQRANFESAVFGMTNLADVDLSVAINLNSVKHLEPSSIGIDTLFRSKGKISDVFLRGCGVSDDFITYSRSLVTTPLDYYSCFISHSHVDKAFARRLHDALQGRGIRCWLDEKQLLPGDEIHEGIRLWDKVLLCASKDSLESWWVNSEIEKAFEKERRLTIERKKKAPEERGKKPLALIPLDLDGYLFDGWKSGYASDVKKRVAADFRHWRKNHDNVEQENERVAKALRTGEISGQAPPEPKL